MVGKSLFSTVIGTMSQADSGPVGWQHTAVYGGKMDGSTVIATLFSAASGCCRML